MLCGWSLFIVYGSLTPTVGYRWLNDSLSVSVGEVGSQENGPTKLIIGWAELVWEPVAE